LHRWSPTLTMMLVSTISYVDRNTLALLIPTIRAETGLSAEQYGWIVSAFSVAYMLGNPAWGALLDRIGVRIGMTAAVGWWSVASAAHAWAGSFASFAALRFALGFGEGATFPGALRTVHQTLPPDRRGRGIALSYSGGALGAILTPILMTPVAKLLGWRGAFLVTGLLGAAWLAWWLWLSRDPSIRALTRESSQARLNFRDVRLWGTLASYSMGAVPLGFVLYNSSLYLTAKFEVSQVGLGALLWIPPAGWEAGYFFWGWMCDRVGMANVGKLMRVAMVLSLPLAIAPRTDSLPLLMLHLFVAMFMTSGFIIPSINYATHIVPKGATSLVAGLGAGSFSLLTAILAPFFGRFFDQARYETAFALATVFPVMGYAIWRATNRPTA
jgi:ACS family hexuronate transporter-like MFS transporter